MNTRFISLLFTISGIYINLQGQDLLLNWPVNTDELPVHCSFGEIHETGGDHFHGGIDIYIANSDVYPVEDGIVIVSNDQNIIIEHDNNRRTQYYHLSNRYVNVGEIIAGGTTEDNEIGTMDDHLHFEMRQSVNNIEFRLNPLGNDLWMLGNTPNDNNAPQINDVYIEPLRNENNNVGSGFDIDDNATGITAPNGRFDGFAQVHLQDRPQGPDIAEYILNPDDYNINKLIVFGNIGLIVNTRDVRINSNGCGSGLTIKDIRYSIYNPINDVTTQKFRIDFDRIPNNELYNPERIFHIDFNEVVNGEDDRLYGNNDYIKMCVTNDNNDGFVYPHKTIDNVRSNVILCGRKY